MTILTGHGCSAVSATSTRSRIDAATTRRRYGRRNGSVQATSEGDFDDELLVVGLSVTSALSSDWRGPERTRDHPGTDGQIRDDECDNLVFARVGDVQPALSRRESHSRRRAEGDAPFVAHIADDAVGSDGADQTVVVIGDEDRDTGVVFGERDTGGAGEVRPRRCAVVS